MNTQQHELPNGWFSATDEEAERLQRELELEMIEGHALYGIPLHVIAHRAGASDDILCKIVNKDDHYAVVHLTWTMKPEISVGFPSIPCQGTFQDFLEFEKQNL